MLSLNKYFKTGKRLIVFLFLFKNSISQNLINNGSFENYTSPINCGGGGFDNYNNTPVIHVVNDWYTLNSPDYYSNLCNMGGYSVPYNIIGYSQAKQGNSYSAFLLYGVSYETKEYIYQQLSNPLQAGKMYCLSFYVSRADRVTHAIHSIGAYFSNNIQSVAALGYVNATPQIINQSGFVTDTANWVQIQGCYTASGGEQYITIGNFNSNANTDTLFAGSNDPHPGADRYAYYYIDDITLIDQTTVGFNELNDGRSVSVYPNPANDAINFQFSSTEEKRKIELYDAIGNLVLNEDASTQNSSLKTHHLQSGIYFYTILVREKNIKTDKVVIIK
ncbi:MAG: T9SS type A sorting domain-containing protein [Bacteroidia bacterium]